MGFSFSFWNALTEIDYLLPYRFHVLPIEVKAGTRGGMKILWSFMRDKHLGDAVRSSLENFSLLSLTESVQ